MGSTIEKLSLNRRELLAAVLVAVITEIVLTYQSGLSDPFPWLSALLSMLVTAGIFVALLLLLKRYTDTSSGFGWFEDR